MTFSRGNARGSGGAMSGSGQTTNGTNGTTPARTNGTAPTRATAQITKDSKKKIILKYLLISMFFYSNSVLYFTSSLLVFKKLSLDMDWAMATTGAGTNAVNATTAGTAIATPPTTMNMTTTLVPFVVFGLGSPFIQATGHSTNYSISSVWIMAPSLLVLELVFTIVIGYYYDKLNASNQNINQIARQNENETSASAATTHGIQETAAELAHSPHKYSRKQLLYLNGLGLVILSLLFLSITSDHDASFWFHLPVYGCELLFRIGAKMQLVSLRAWTCDFEIVHARWTFLIQAMAAFFTALGYSTGLFLGLAVLPSYAVLATVTTLAVALGLLNYYLVSGFSGFREEGEGGRQRPVSQKHELVESEQQQPNHREEDDGDGDYDVQSIISNTSCPASLISQTPPDTLPLNNNPHHTTSLTETLHAALLHGHIDREVFMVLGMGLCGWTAVYAWICILEKRMMMVMRTDTSPTLVWRICMCITVSTASLLVFVYFWRRRRAAYSSRFVAVGGVVGLFVVATVFAASRFFNHTVLGSAGMAVDGSGSVPDLGVVAGLVGMSGVVGGAATMVLLIFPYVYVTLHRKRHGGISIGLLVSFIECMPVLGQLIVFFVGVGISGPDAVAAREQVFGIVAAVGSCLLCVFALYMKERMKDVAPLKKAVSHLAF